MSRVCLTIAFGLAACTAGGQSIDRLLGAGNSSYRAGDYTAAAAAYRKALALDASNPIVHHNLASALFRSDDPAGAERHFHEAASQAPDGKQSARSWYSKGVSLTRQGKTEESIEAYKRSLRIDPSNEWARENLVRALREKRDKDARDRKKDPRENEDRGKPPPEMDRRDLQRMLEALREQERRLRKKAGQPDGAPSSREKDW